MSVPLDKGRVIGQVTDVGRRPFHAQLVAALRSGTRAFEQADPPSQGGTFASTIASAGWSRRSQRMRTSNQSRRSLISSQSYWGASPPREVKEANGLSAGATEIKLGHGRHRRASFGWESLTGAELRVVGLAAEGLTNREIAARLFVSRRTVATHLEHVFQKLGFSTRVRLAVEAALRSAEVSS